MSGCGLMGNLDTTYNSIAPFLEGGALHSHSSANGEWYWETEGGLRATPCPIPPDRVSASLCILSWMFPPPVLLSSQGEGFASKRCTLGARRCSVTPSLWLQVTAPTYSSRSQISGRTWVNFSLLSFQNCGGKKKEKLCIQLCRNTQKSREKWCQQILFSQDFFFYAMKRNFKIKLNPSQTVSVHWWNLFVPSSLWTETLALVALMSASSVLWVLLSMPRSQRSPLSMVPMDSTPRGPHSDMRHF